MRLATLLALISGALLLFLAWFFYTRHKDRVEMQHFKDSLRRHEDEARLRDFEAKRIADETKPPP